MKRDDDSRNEKPVNRIKEINRLREEIRKSMAKSINKRNKEDIEFLMKRL